MTPYGFKPIREIKVGDQVCAVDGTATKVIAVYDRGVQPLYRCHFSDGSTIDVDGDHIWQGWRVNQTVKKGGERTSGVASTRNYTMGELSGFVGVERNRAEYATNRLAIPVPEPVMCSVQGTLVGRSNFVSRAGLHPYVLGVLLGDGCLTDTKSILFCSADEEIPARVRSLLDVDAWMSEPYNYGEPASTYRINSPAAMATLTALGVMGKFSHEKSIPRIYKMATVEERWELLRGLMDTDGWCEKNGDAYFSSTSKRLADDVRDLGWSLGAVVSMSDKIPTYTYLGEKKEGRQSYTVRLKFRDNSMAFHLERKKERCADKEYQSFARYMERIEPIEPGESICIAVAHPSCLFIANDYLTTHNTDALIGAWLMHMNFGGEHTRGVFFRRTYPELTEVWTRMLELYPATGAESNKSELTFTWPHGPKIELRYLENDDDAARYMGRNWSFAAWDEICNWADPAPLDKLWATLRSAKGVPCIRRLAGNPGGPGTQWVKERYIDDRRAYVPFKWAPNKRLPHLTIESIFIPALLDDNKILLDNDPGYESRLAAIGDDELYKAWRYGDWNILSGRYFGAFKPDRSVVSQVALPSYFPRWIAIDHGYAHDAAVTWGCYDGTTVYIYREFSASEMTPPEIARTIVQMTGRDERIECVYLSPDASNRRSSPRTVEQEYRESLPWPVRKADNDRIGGWSLMQSMFKSGTLKVFDDCKKLIKWLSLAQRDPKRPEDVLKQDGDDLGDSARYLIKTSEITPRIPDEVIFDQRLKPFTDKGDYFGAMVERFKIEDELHKGKQPVRLRGKRRR